LSIFDGFVEISIWRSTQPLIPWAVAWIEVWLDRIAFRKLGRSSLLQQLSGTIRECFAKLEEYERQDQELEASELRGPAER